MDLFPGAVRDNEFVDYPLLVALECYNSETSPEMLFNIISLLYKIYPEAAATKNSPLELIIKRRKHLAHMLVPTVQLLVVDNPTLAFKLNEHGKFVSNAELILDLNVFRKYAPWFATF